MFLRTDTGIMNFTWREILLAPFYAVQFIYYRFCDWWAGYPPVE